MIYINLMEFILLVLFVIVVLLLSFCKWGFYVDLIEVDVFYDFYLVWLDINIVYRLLWLGGVMFGYDYFIVVDK